MKNRLGYFYYDFSILIAHYCKPSQDINDIINTLINPDLIRIERKIVTSIIKKSSQNVSDLK